jgi:hypothetical protein
MASGPWIPIRIGVELFSTIGPVRNPRPVRMSIGSSHVHQRCPLGQYRVFSGIDLAICHLASLECSRIELGIRRDILELEDLLPVEVEDRTKATPHHLADLELAAHEAADISPLRRQVMVVAPHVRDVLDRVAIAPTKCMAGEHRIHANATLGRHREANVETLTTRA